MVCHQESKSMWTWRWFYVKEDTGGLQMEDGNIWIPPPFAKTFSISTQWNLYLEECLFLLYEFQIWSQVSTLFPLLALLLSGHPAELYWWLKRSCKLLRGLRENFKRSWSRELFRRFWKEMMHRLSIIIIGKKKQNPGDNRRQSA